LGVSVEPFPGQKKTEPPYSQDDPVRRVAYQPGYPKSKALMFNPPPADKSHLRRARVFFSTPWGEHNFRLIPRCLRRGSLLEIIKKNGAGVNLALWRNQRRIVFKYLKFV
jgi:hypothetical protein